MKKKLILTLIIGFILFLVPSDLAYAKTGDFYNDHKEHFEDLPKQIKDVIKKYDYETNTFDCGWTHFYCKYSSFMYENAIGAIKAGLKTGESAIIAPWQITGNQIFNNYKNALKTSAWLMLSIFLAWNIAKIVAHRFADAEDGGVALNEKILKITVLAIILGVYETIFYKILELQYYAVQGVMGNPVTLEDITITIFKYGSYYGLLMALLIGVTMLIFNIAFIYRFVLFGVLYIMGVVAIPTGINDEYNYFSLWLRLLVSNGVTLFLQALCFVLGVNAMFVQNAFNEGTAVVVAMAFWVLALAIPSLLGNLGASTGTSRAVGSVIRAVTRRR